LIGMVGMIDKRNEHLSRLSGGQQKRVALAMRSKVMMIGEVSNVIRKLVQEYNLTMLMVPHQMGFVRDISDRICCLFGGRIEDHGMPAELLGNLQEEPAQKFHSVVSSAA